MGLAMAGTMGGAGVAAPMIQRNMEAAEWQRRHPGEQVPDYYGSDEDLAAYKARNASLSASQTEAGKTLPGLEGNLEDMRNRATAVLNTDPTKLQSLLERMPNTIQLARQEGGWGPLIAKGVSGMDPNDLKLLQQIDELRSYNTSGMKTANPHLMGSIAPIDNALAPLSNFNLGADNFRTSAQNLVDSIDSAHAQAIGASGQLDKLFSIPNNDEKQSVMGKIDDSYIAGGRNFLGDLKRPPPGELAKVRAQIAQGLPPATAVRLLRAKGFVPRPGDIPGA